MPICPTCFAKYPGEVSTCPTDGMSLVPDETFAHVDKDVTEGMVVGEYRIESKLGEGGFGAVFRAVHPLIGKMAAVKVLSRQFSSNPQMVSRFVAEARAVNQIRHRNIIDIFSFGQLPDGRQYYIMELLEGSSFDAYIAKKKRLPISEALPLLRGVARALDAAHAKGILHRDLKPENVYLVFDEDGRIEPKLLDFGLVKLLGAEGSGSGSGSGQGQHKTKTGTPMGTPYYMSPEQCRGLDVDARTDVYSFGAMVFEALTGEVPYNGVSAMDVLVQHMTAEPPRASSRCPELPPEVDAVLARMLAKDPADRPARVGEALDLLAKAANLTSGIASAPISNPDVLKPQDNAPLTDSERAIATTLIADPNAMTPAPVGVRSENNLFVTPTASSGRPAAVGQTFLGAETDVSVPPRAGRSRALLVGSVLGLAGLVGVVALVVTLGLGAKKVEPASVVQGAAAATATTSTTTTTTTAASAQAAPPPPRADADVRVEGAPDGTIVSANGTELGKTPGPFKLKIGEPTKLTFTAKGYKTKEMTITPTENVLLPVTLDKAAAAGAVGNGRRPNGPSPASTAINPDLEGFDKK